MLGRIVTRQGVVAGIDHSAKKAPTLRCDAFVKIARASREAGANQPAINSSNGSTLSVTFALARTNSATLFSTTTASTSAMR